MFTELVRIHLFLDLLRKYYLTSFNINSNNKELELAENIENFRNNPDESSKVRG